MCFMNPDTIFRWIAIGAIGISITISAFYRRKAARSGERISHSQEEGWLLMCIRVFFGLGMWLSVLVYMINPGWLDWAQLDLPLWLRWAGAIVLVSCVPLIYWVFSSLDRNVTGTVAIRQEHQLVTHGPYHYVRHPLYTVGFCAFLGFTLMAANWLIACFVIGGMLILAKRTPLEEQRLLERFGEGYQQYMLTTGKYIPKF
jgi:protein-S-isoprenylcysteine O-methyltransferase Ste14